jgi:hypothetical protein
MNQSELDSFYYFATNVLTHADHDLTIEGLVQRWRAEREQADTIQSVLRGVVGAEAGRTYHLADVDARIRKELGFSGRRK